MYDMIHTFNTGRKYTVHGQRIIAKSRTDGRGPILFNDLDRMIYGSLDREPPEGWASLTEKERQSYILHEYDCGYYRWHQDADALRKEWQ